MGDNQDLVNRELDNSAAADEPGPDTSMHWNPVTYRCRFCDASFRSREMIRRHLEHHARERAAALPDDQDEMKAA